MKFIITREVVARGHEQWEVEAATAEEARAVFAESLGKFLSDDGLPDRDYFHERVVPAP